MVFFLILGVFNKRTERLVSRGWKWQKTSKPTQQLSSSGVEFTLSNREKSTEDVWEAGLQPPNLIDLSTQTAETNRSLLSAAPTMGPTRVRRI